MNSKEFLKWLKSHGATLKDGKGSHIKVYYQGKQSVLPMHTKDLPKGTLMAILKQLNLRDIFENEK
jgi:mRNA interferase HicA